MTDRFHAVYDYLISVFVILSPWIFGFYNSPMAMKVTVGFGIVSLLDALLTGHKASVLHKAPMYYHLAIDSCWGLLFVMSPWFFGFSNVVFVPQMVIGFLVIAIAGLTHLPKSEQNPG